MADEMKASVDEGHRHNIDGEVQTEKSTYFVTLFVQSLQITGIYHWW